MFSILRYLKLTSYNCQWLCYIFALSLSTAAIGQDLNALDANTKINSQELASQLEVGDVVFIHVSALPFEKISNTTGSWANHVGVVLDVSGKDPIIGESRVPLSGTTTLSRFVARSKAGRVEVSRLNTTLTISQKNMVLIAAKKRSGILYDTGFNLHSNRQFCSRYVREVLNEATGVNIGEVEKFTTLLTSNPNIDLTFWRIWYLGSIPWGRETVSPASLLRSPMMYGIFNGYIA